MGRGTIKNDVTYSGISLWENSFRFEKLEFIFLN